MVECLPSVCEALGGVLNREWWLMPVISEFGKVETKGSVQNQPCFHSDFEASLGYMKPCF